MDQGRKDGVGVGVATRVTVIPVSARIYINNIADQARTDDVDQPLMLLGEAKHMAGQNEARRQHH
jgi:hypothetical protein